MRPRVGSMVKEPSSPHTGFKSSRLFRTRDQPSFHGCDLGGRHPRLGRHWLRVPRTLRGRRFSGSIRGGGRITGYRTRPVRSLGSDNSHQPRHPRPGGGRMGRRERSRLSSLREGKEPDVRFDLHRDRIRDRPHGPLREEKSRRVRYPVEGADELEAGSAAPSPWGSSEARG